MESPFPKVADPFGTVPDLPPGVGPVTVGKGWEETEKHGRLDHSDTPYGYATRHIPNLRDQNLDWLFRENSDWAFAPESSHLSRWLAVSDPEEKSYLLLARFRGREGGESRTYTYFFPSLDELGMADERLRRSLHPYSSVFYPHIIQAGIPYQ